MLSICLCGDGGGPTNWPTSGVELESDLEEGVGVKRESLQEGSVYLYLVVQNKLLAIDRGFVPHDFRTVRNLRLVG
jgi:hypothetical protein